MPIKIFDCPNHNIFQRDPHSANGYPEAWGSYDGTSSSVQVALAGGGAPAGTNYGDFAEATLYPTQKLWKITKGAGQGLWLGFQARYGTNNSTVVAQQSVWGAGVRVAWLGESTSERMFQWNGTGNTCGSYALKYQGPLAMQDTKEEWTWTPNGYGVANADIAFHNSGPTQYIPFACINASRSGSKIADYLDEGGAAWAGFIKTFDAIGRQAEFIVLQLGINDVLAGTTKAAYKRDLGILYRRLLAYFGRTPDTLTMLVVRIGGVVTGGVTYNATNVQAAIDEFCAETAGVIACGDEANYTKGDGVHINLDNTNCGALGTVIGNTIRGLM